MKKFLSFFSFFIFALLFCACSFLDNGQKTGSVSFSIGDGVYSKISTSRAADENTEGEYYLRITLNGDYSEEKTMPIHENTIRAIITFGDIPEGAEVWAYALIYKVFNGEKEYILEGKSEKITIAEGENALSITMTSYKGGNESNGEDTTSNGELIGTKASPTTIGDIVFSDKSAIAYSADLVLTEMQKAEAVAVIFYDGSGTMGDRILGVGLEESEPLSWATGATGTATNFSTDTDNGKENWDVITRADTSAEATSSTSYPAFYYANSYTANGFLSDWYIPAKTELEALRDKVTTVNNAIEKIGVVGAVVKISKTSTTASHYWTSSQASSLTTDNYTSYYGNFSSSASFSGTARNDTCHVRVIHEF